MRWLRKGMRPRLPLDFDNATYLELNPDVAAAGVDPAWHYLAWGVAEGRHYRTPPPEPNDPVWIMGRPTEMDAAFHQNPLTKRSTLGRHTAIWDWVRANASSPGCRVLELGSRSVISDALWRNVIPDCDYTGFDVMSGRNVDVVGDAHRLSSYFEANSFDFVISFAVFEHLAMPWIVAEEIRRVLAVGGYVCLETTFAFSEHELPAHYFQFNSGALETLFCPEMGFEVVDSGLDNPIVGRFAMDAAEYLRGAPVTDLYCHSSLIARKTSNPPWTRAAEAFDWRSVADRISRDNGYPIDSGMV